MLPKSNNDDDVEYHPTLTQWNENVSGTESYYFVKAEIVN